MRARFFGPTASTAPQTERLLDDVPDAFRSLDVDIRDADGGRPALRASTRDELELVIHTAAQPSHDWAATDPQTDFTVNANGTLNLLEATRQHKPDATFVFTSTNKVYGDRPNRLPLVELETRLELPRGPRVLRRDPDTSMSIDRCLHSLFGVSKVAADLMVQEYGRYFDMPTVCFRGGCLTGPNHAGAQLHGFLSYLMRCTVDRRAVHRLRLRRQAGARQHPQRRPRAGLRRVPREPRAPARSTTSAAAGRATARCSRRSRSASRSPAASSTGTLGPDARIGDHRWWISDLAAFQARLPGLGARVRHRRDPARDLRGERRERGRRSPMKLSVVIPAHNEAGSIGATVARDRGRARRRGRSTTRSSWSTTRARDGTRRRSTRARRGRTHASGACRSHNPPGFGFAVRAGLDVFEGDAVAIVMADGSDEPGGHRRATTACSRRATTARSARASCAARAVHDYPRFKLALNRIVNFGIRVLFRHGYNDTTNAFKAYRREVIETVQPLLSNHFNLTVELPLKAIVRGHSYKVVPISWTNRTAGVSKLWLQEMGSRYLFIVLYVFLERHLRRGDYHRAEPESSGTQNSDGRVLPEAAPPIT